MKDNQDTGGKTKPERGPAFASRRTIVKGVASVVPVVMTLGCGKAMANASNYQCIGQTVVEPPAQCIDPADYPNGDGWVRAATDISQDDGTTVSRQCLVYVDEAGNQVASNNGTGFPVTASCYASFM